MNFSSLFHTSFLFWIIMDPLGNCPLFVSILRHYDPAHQRRIIVREMWIALVIMVVFLFFGHALLSIVGVEQPTLQIAGGIILFLIAIRMVFATPKKTESKLPPREPFIVPLAMPAVAGPAILATISLYGGGIQGNKLSTLIAILIAWACLLPILLLATNLKKILGEKGLVAVERLFGYIIVLAASQMALNGLASAFGHPHA